MGKKGKKTTRRCQSSNNTVSIVTPSLKNRIEFLKICADCILLQTALSKIVQWVIVSADKEWCETEFNNTICELQSIINKITPKLKVDGCFITEKLVKAKKWPESSNYEAIGYLRNITNKLVVGDFIVCMDDDDYYPPKRVEHAIESLCGTKEVAGCSNHIMYDADLKTVFQWKRFGPNHSVNNALAYKKSYLEKGALYDSSKTFAEEKSFLQDHKTPMVQMDPVKTVVQMVHFNNTYNKRKLLIMNAWQDSKVAKVNKISSKPQAFVPQTFLNKYKKALLYDDNEVSKYDIVYYVGMGAPVWSPYGQKLGGSEQAVKMLVENWVKMGYSVAVYGEFDSDVTKQSLKDSNTADYFSYMDFKCSIQYNILIFWRRYGTHPMISWPFIAKQVYIDLHDSIPLTESCLDNLDKVQKIFVRSKFHKQMIINHHKKYNLQEKIMIIPNGVRLNYFTPTTNSSKRDLYRFCWCSCYKRGLMNILAWVWPIIKHYEPRAEYHIYYGMESCEQEFKDKMNQLLKQPGVFDHGRQSVDYIVREKHTASFHLYFSKTTAETDCISIRESTCAGCIPIISEYNVFSERNGIRLPGDPFNKEDMQKVAVYILQLMKDPEKIENIRSEMIGKETSWYDVASLWPFVEKNRIQKENIELPKSDIQNMETSCKTNSHIVTDSNENDLENEKELCEINMDKIDKLFYINLDRRLDRNEHMIRELKKIHVPLDKIERFQAYDGLCLEKFNITQDDYKLFAFADFRNNPIKKFLIGNQLSHFQILKTIVEKGMKYAIILQDDLNFIDDFCLQIKNIISSIPNDAEIIWLGFHKHAVGKYVVAQDLHNQTKETNDHYEYVVNEHIAKCKISTNPCSTAYLITLQGAKNFIEYIEKTGFKRATDHNYNEYLRAKNIDYCSRLVLCTGIPNFGSDIFI